MHFHAASASRSHGHALTRKLNMAPNPRCGKADGRAVRKTGSSGWSKFHAFLAFSSAVGMAFHFTIAAWPLRTAAWDQPSSHLRMPGERPRSPSCWERRCSPWDIVGWHVNCCGPGLAACGCHLAIWNWVVSSDFGFGHCCRWWDVYRRVFEWGNWKRDGGLTRPYWWTSAT